jgi:large subunit ribosomal protein L5
MLLESYKNKVIPELMESMSCSFHEVPRVVKIVLNMGLGLVSDDVINKVRNELADIAGQRPVITRASKSVSGFKIRQGMSLGLKVTLRKRMMFYFMERMLYIALPRIRDFKGFNPRSFDGNGGFTIGISEHIIFPEVNFDTVDSIRGIDVSILTTAKDRNSCIMLLSKLGFPFIVDSN